MSASPAASRWRRSAASACWNALCDAGYEVSLETSGAIDIAAVDPRVSRVRRPEDAGLDGDASRNLLSNIPLLTPHDQVKFVICDRADYEWARGDAAEHALLALRGAVLAQLRPAGGARAGRVDPRRPPAGALPDAAAQAALGRCAVAKYDAQSARPMPERRAVVLVSGGMDSAVVLALARERGLECHALSVSYGQRHAAELDAAAELARTQGAVEHKTVVVDLRSIGGSALTADIDVPESGRRRHPGHLRAGAQHHHAVGGAGLGRGAGRGRDPLRRERGRLLRLSGLPAGIHRRLRAPRHAGHQGRRRRLADCACMRR